MKVKQAAIKDSRGTVHTLPRPARHHTVIHDCKVQLDSGSVQGFILEDGTFVGREEAADHALHEGQIKALGWPPNLYSEDLW